MPFQRFTQGYIWPCLSQLALFVSMAQLGRGNLNWAPWDWTLVHSKYFPQRELPRGASTRMKKSNLDKSLLRSWSHARTYTVVLPPLPLSSLFSMCLCTCVCLCACMYVCMCMHTYDGECVCAHLNAGTLGAIPTVKRLHFNLLSENWVHVYSADHIHSLPLQLLSSPLHCIPQHLFLEKCNLGS